MILSLPTNPPLLISEFGAEDSILQIDFSVIPKL